ncbi:hypothetical protein ACWEQ1_03465 [Streptomyces nodosus]
MNTEQPDEANDALETAEDGGKSAPRRRRSLIVASVAAAVLLAGGGGVLLSTGASGGTGGSAAPGGDGAPPPLVLDGRGEGAAPGIAVGEPDPYGTEYKVTGSLPDGPDSAPVYWAKGRVTRDEVARLAEALDLVGTPRLVGSVWQVGTAEDGAEPYLRVDRDAPGQWTYGARPQGSDNCLRGRPCKPSGSAATGAGTGPVSETTAKRAAAPVLTAAGQGDARLDASQLMGQARVVNAEPRVGGLPTAGWTTGIRIGSDGTVIGGSGRLKAPVEGAVYPVVDARRALDLPLGATPSYGRKGIGGCVGPVPLKDRDEAPCTASTLAPERPSASVRGAVFGLAAEAVGGRPVLVPSWLFRVRPAGAAEDITVTRPAVDPRYTAPPRAASTAEPGTGGPGRSDQSSGASARRAVEVLGYHADGRDLTVSYQGGVCADYAVSVDEGSGEVTVTVTETSAPGRICIMVAKQYRETVRLRKPLGDREVVGEDGMPVPKGITAVVPSPSSAGGQGPVRS